jgi:hypothetical protein
MLVMTEAESSLVESDVAIHNAALSALAGGRTERDALAAVAEHFRDTKKNMFWIYLISVS